MSPNSEVLISSTELLRYQLIRQKIDGNYKVSINI